MGSDTFCYLALDFDETQFCFFVWFMLWVAHMRKKKQTVTSVQYEVIWIQHVQWYILLLGTVFSLRVRTVSKKTCEIAHVKFKFKLGLKCQTSVIFWTMKDGSLTINTLSIIICFTCKTSFKMTLTIYQKWLTCYAGFLSNRSKFCVIWIIRFCSKFASLW